MNATDVGQFEMSPTGPFEAGAYATIVFTYTVGPAGLKKGGRLRIATPNQGWGEPLVLCPNPIEELVEGPERTHNPWKPLNTTFALHTKTKAWVRMWAEERHCVQRFVRGRDGWEWARRATQWRWWINADVEVADFAPGDQIVITYGDTDQHPDGVLVQPFPEEATRPFLCVVDVEGNGELREVSGSGVCVAVAPGPPEKPIVVVPSLLRPGEGFDPRVSVLDRNLAPPATEYWGDMNMDATDEDLLDDETCEENIVRVCVATSVGDAASNPALVTEDKQEHLYWGDLHAQCCYHMWDAEEGRGHSTLSPAELHHYAKECTFLDFVALCNVACPMPHNPGWEETQQAAIDAYEPRRYVAFKGWECGMGVQGDRCVVYREAEVEPHFDRPQPTDDCPTPAHALLKFCRESPYKIMTINHSFMKYLDWSVFDAEIDRVIEVYSCWGSYESRHDNPLNSKRCPRNQSAMHALSLGYTPGFVAAGDSHVGYPGRSLMFSDPNRCQNWKAGLAAVFAPELTREAIWDALYNRHCYGTTGERIVLLFRLNGQPMGSVLEYPADDARLMYRDIEVTVCGTDLIRRVDIIKNNALLQRVCPESDRSVFSLIDELEEPPTTRDWYYVRVFQADGNAAWSSPIYLGPQGVTTPSESLGE